MHPSERPSEHLCWETAPHLRTGRATQAPPGPDTCKFAPRLLHRLPRELAYLGPEVDAFAPGSADHTQVDEVQSFLVRYESLRGIETVVIQREQE